MPVVVTGADEPIGGAVARALAGRGLDVRATVGRRAVVDELVALGVRTALCEVVDVERLGGVVEGAHTVLHLRGGAGQALVHVPDVLAALEDSGVTRLVTLAPIGALTPAERIGLSELRDSGLDVVVLRVAAVARAGAVDLVRPRFRRVAPIALDDLVAALLAADRLRDLHGYRELDAVGPDLLTGSDVRGLLRRRQWWRAWERAWGRQPDLAGDGGRALGEVLGVRAGGRTALAEAVRPGR